MGCIASTCRNGDYRGIPGTHNMSDQPVMRLCAPGKDSSNFADVGDTVVLFVDFGPYCSPCQHENIGDTVNGLDRVRETAAMAMPSGSHGGQQRYDFEVILAGVLTKLTCLHPAVKDSKAYKATIKIPTEQRQGVLVDGECIPVSLPFRTAVPENRTIYREINQDAIEQQHAIYFHSIWNQLKTHNKNSIRRSTSRDTSLMGRYGSMGRTSPAYGTHDQMDGSDQLTSVEQEAVRTENQRRDGMKPKRYWPDSWQMRCWKKGFCDRILRSDKPIPRFFARFFVAPLVNVTALSLYYQLYLSEIFHTRFWTRALHYACMPIIVMMMLVFFAQWRFVLHVDDDGCYKNGNLEVVILNGALLLGLLFWFWYLLWGAIQQTTLMGIFMVGPLLILYLLANIFFQVSIKNSIDTPCNSCWIYKSYASGHIQYYDLFKLMEWYYNPVLWAFFFSFVQAMSHACEPQLPPRVNQTAHWMSCSEMCKRSGYTKATWIMLSQSIFGTIDEFLASPRLLPIFVLRMCYELGYHPKQWKWMKKLVKKCQQYGDPALDYIGTGGAQHISEHSIVFKDNFNIDDLKTEVQSMEQALTSHQKEILNSPSLLREYKQSGVGDPFLDHYVVLRHYVAQYTLQVYAYGPFRLEGDDHRLCEMDNERMRNDFGDNESFMNFLQQVRFALWKMEDDLIEKRTSSPCCNNIEEV